MPVTPTYPGLYIEELPSSVHTITPAPTNVAVFIGYSHPLKTKAFGVPVPVFGFSDYQASFGGFFNSTPFAQEISEGKFGDLALAVNQFFINGGTQAYVVGLQSGLAASTLASPSGIVTLYGLQFQATQITDETHQLTITIRPIPAAGTSSPPAPATTADITLVYGPAALPNGEAAPGTVTETYRQVSLNSKDPTNYIASRINGVSNLVQFLPGSPQPAAFTSTTAGTSSISRTFPAQYSRNTPIYQDSDFTAVMVQDSPLDKLQGFSLLLIPGVTVALDSTNAVSDSLVISTAIAFAERKLAFLILDPPITATTDSTAPLIQDVVADPGFPRSKNAALYYPFVNSTDPVTAAPITLPPSASVAGIFAATDLNRGVWKAPAGIQATTSNTNGVVTSGRMTDQRQGLLNPLGINCLRDFPNIGTTVFGSRTLVTLSDPQWRYVPVRRTALFLEQTLLNNLTWVVFEPNDAPLWGAIQTSINSFMLGLFRQGAFQGSTPKDAFLVKCDATTTTQDDIDNGIVNILVGFAPLKPAEFVIIQIAQLAGQSS